MTPTTPSPISDQAAGEKMTRHELDCEFMTSDNPWSPCTCGFGRPGVVEMSEAPPVANDLAFHARVARLLAEMHGEEILSEQQCAKIFGVDLIAWREIEHTFSRGTGWVEPMDDDDLLDLSGPTTEDAIRATLESTAPTTGSAPDACKVSPYSSRGCELGTKGCYVRHAASPAASVLSDEQLDKLGSILFTRFYVDTEFDRWDEADVKTKLVFTNAARALLAASIGGDKS